MIAQEVDPFQIVLPPEVSRSLSDRGFAPSCPEEERRVARLRVGVEATMQFLSTLPTYPRTDRVQSIIIKDISKSGIGILYHQQCYPGEEALIHFQGRTLRCVAVRCRRLGPNCYNVGFSLQAIQRQDEENYS